MAEHDYQNNSGTESDIPNPKKGAPNKAILNDVETYFESFYRVKKLPVVEAAIAQGQKVYGKVKGHNFLFNWMMSTAEGAVQVAVAISVPLVTPVMQIMIEPIAFVDLALVKGIDKLAIDAPIIEEQPDEIFRQVKEAITSSIGRKVDTIKTSSYNRAHNVLDTKLGHVAMSKVQRLVKMTDTVLDKYFPYSDEDEYSEAMKKSNKSDRMEQTVDEITTISRRIGNIAQEQFKSLMNNSSSILHPIHYTVGFFN